MSRNSTIKELEKIAEKDGNKHIKASIEKKIEELKKEKINKNL